jgi:hypothetical protein
MSHKYLRLPRVRRLEYLIVFLESYNDDGFDEERAYRAIQQQIHRLEVEKAKALGRQRPRMRKGVYTLKECLRLASDLGLVDRFQRLTPRAAQVLESGRRRSFLLKQMWQVYPRFRQVVLTVRNSERLHLPLYNWDAFRQEGGNLYGLDFDRLNFEIVRDLTTQLGLVNWHPTEDKPKRQIVYPVGLVATFREIISLAGLHVEQETFAQQCRHQAALDLNLLVVQNDCYEAQAHVPFENPSYMILQTDSDYVFFRGHDVSSEEFEQVLWKEYLSLSSMRPRFPVLYPSLRNRVCAVLRISDQVFDHHLLSLIQRPRRLDIYPSGGVLNYAANLAHLVKFLPPKTSQGNFIVYLKIDRRSA